MRIDGFPGEKPILSFKLTNGAGWLTTHRLITQKEKHNSCLNTVETKEPEMYLLSNFERAEVDEETLTVHFKGWQTAIIRLQTYSPSLFSKSKTTCSS